MSLRPPPAPHSHNPDEDGTTWRWEIERLQNRVDKSMWIGAARSWQNSSAAIGACVAGIQTLTALISWQYHWNRAGFQNVVHSGLPSATPPARSVSPPPAQPEEWRMRWLHKSTSGPKTSSETMKGVQLAGFRRLPSALQPPVASPPEPPLPAEPGTNLERRESFRLSLPVATVSGNCFWLALSHCSCSCLCQSPQTPGRHAP